jgi:hypothetical protein
MSDVVAADRVPVAVHRAVAPIAHRSGRRCVPATTRPAFGRPFTIGLRRANRAFAARGVRHAAADRGARQVLNIGAGLLAPGCVHQVVQQMGHATRVAYVDHDPVVVAHTAEQVAANPMMAAMEGDLRSPYDILQAAAVQGPDLGQRACTHDADPRHRRDGSPRDERGRRAARPVDGRRVRLDSGREVADQSRGNGFVALPNGGNR